MVGLAAAVRRGPLAGGRKVRKFAIGNTVPDTQGPYAAKHCPAGINQIENA